MAMRKSSDYLSRLRSPLLSGAVLPDPDLELADAGKTSLIAV